MKYFVMCWVLLCGCDEYTMTVTQIIKDPGQAKGKYRVLQGDYSEDVRILNTDATRLRGTVRILEGAYLRIDNGAVVYGEWETTGKLIIEKGAFCIGIGTMETPIRFTSDQVKKPHAGDWEGIVLNGLTRIENLVVEYAKIGLTVNNTSVRIYNGFFRKNEKECDGIDELVWRRQWYCYTHLWENYFKIRFGYIHDREKRSEKKTEKIEEENEET